MSVPASFRAALSEQFFQGIILIRSHSYQALEGFGQSMMDELSMRLDEFDLFSDEQDDLATAIFGEAVPLPFDGEGRVVLPAELMEHAGIVERAAFVGMGRKFQIWDPDVLKERRLKAMDNVRKKGLTLPKGGG